MSDLPGKRTWLLVLGTITLLSVGAGHIAQAQRNEKEKRVVTAAEIFEKTLTQMKERQKKEPWDPKSRDSNRYKLLEVKVEDWLATEEGRYAHSIKIPNPVPADSGYRKGMTQQEYFEHLCKNEAGEFIFKTVDNVGGIFQLRPRRVYTAEEQQHLYAMEDPYGYWPGEAERVGFTFVKEHLYSYFEIPVSGRRVYGLSMKNRLDPSLSAEPPADTRVARYYGNSGETWRNMRLEYDAKAKARYGFTWRGIKRLHDRELGIAGGELIVLDLQTGEILGVRRGYVVWNGGWTGRVCPRYGYSGGQDKTTYFTTWFVAKVIRPSEWKEFFAVEEKGRRIVGNMNDKRY